jgi:hypothetical protein
MIVELGDVKDFEWRTRVHVVSRISAVAISVTFRSAHEDA